MNRSRLPPKVATLLAFYPFEGNAQDASGNGRHGTINGGLQQVTGYEGQAYYFNGGADYITLPLDINPDKYPQADHGRLGRDGWAAHPLQTILTHDNGGFDRCLDIDYRGDGNGWSAFCGPTGQVLGAVPAILEPGPSWPSVYDQAAQTVKLQVDDMVLTKTAVTMGTGRE